MCIRSKKKSCGNSLRSHVAKKPEDALRLFHSLIDANEKLVLVANGLKKNALYVCGSSFLSGSRIISD